MTKPNELPNDALLHLKDTHVGSPTEKLPLTDADWINFARAVIAASMASQATAELPELPAPIRFTQWTGGEEFAYSADQMQAYGLAGFEAGMASRAQSEGAEIVTQADVNRARELILDATSTDLLSGDRKVKKADRATVYRWLCKAASVLVGKVPAAPPVETGNAFNITAGFALVPYTPTREMERVMTEDSWEWADVLAAAGAVTEEEYTQATAPPVDAVPGEPVAKIKRGAQTPWGHAGVLVEWLPGLQALTPGEHEVYAAPVASRAGGEPVAIKPWQERLPRPFDDAGTWDRFAAALAEINDWRTANIAPAAAAEPGAELVKCERCGHENWIMEGKAPCQITESDRAGVASLVASEGMVLVPKETLSRWRKWCLGYEWPKAQDWDSHDVYLAIADEIRTKYEATDRASSGEAQS